MFLRYLMLVVFPPVGIPMYLHDRYGPRLKIRVLVCIASALWFVFLIWLISRPPVEKHQAKVQARTEIFNEQKIEENKVANLSRSAFRDADSPGKISMIAEALGNNIGGSYASVRFDDGTGIQFPGANIHIKAMYGEMDKDGVVTKTLGSVLIKGDSEYIYTALADEEVLKDDLIAAFPEDYSSDISDVVVARVGKTGVTVSFIIADPGTDRDPSVKEAFEKSLEDEQFLSDLKKFRRTVEGASVRCQSDGGSDGDDTGSDEKPAEYRTIRLD